MNTPGQTPPSQTPQVRTLLLTDMVDSTGLVERLGDGAAADLFRAHDRMVLELQQRWRGRLIDRSDGLLLIFERPIDGLGFALDYVRGLRELSRERDLKPALQARAGLHVGEVLVWENSVEAVRVGAKSMEVEGLAKPLAGRLMALARPGQILLSATAEPLAHRAARELGERGKLLVWKSYGRWRFKGLPEAQEVYEVGEPGLAPLRMPPHSPKAWRDMPLWRRPAALAAEALLLAVIATGGWFLTRPQPAIAFAERDWVVVGDVRNLTGDARLDDALEQAFRISLEQSQYVNVLSDLKVRETLERMQRKPDAPVDRALGSEIALRDGARALILPTVAEVGGQLRVSAEVVDPRTQTTVHAISADGRGVESVLASIDDVAGELRTTLGEALQSVEKTSAPLQQATTPNLEALKAFSLARVEIETRGDIAAAMGLLDRALQLDPQFALAHVTKAAVYAGGTDEFLKAKASWQRALAIQGRLTSQERLRTEVMLRQLGSEPASLFRMLRHYLTLYPDDFAAWGRLGNNQWQILNDFPAAERSARRMLNGKYPRLGMGHYFLGITLLGQEKYAEALKSFEASRQHGFYGAGDLLPRAYQALRQHEKADRAYAESTVGKQGWRGQAAVVTYIDRGEWGAAKDAAESWLNEASAGDPVLKLRAHAAVATVGALSPQGDASRSARMLAAAAADPKIGGAADAALPFASEEAVLLAGLLGAHGGDAPLVHSLVARPAASTVLRDYPTIAQLHAIVLAEQERLAGRSEAAKRRLAPLARHHDALILVHWALLRAARDAGDHRLARAQAKWLTTHRGRAFTEATTLNVLRFANIEATNSALLELAELEADAGNRIEASRQLAAFVAAIPDAGLHGEQRTRVKRLRDAIDRSQP